MAYYASVDEFGNVTGFYDTVTFVYAPELGLPYPKDFAIDGVIPEDVPPDANIPIGFVRLTTEQWDYHMLGGAIWKWIDNDLVRQDA